MLPTATFFARMPASPSALNRRERSTRETRLLGAPHLVWPAPGPESVAGEVVVPLAHDPPAAVREVEAVLLAQVALEEGIEARVLVSGRGVGAAQQVLDLRVRGRLVHAQDRLVGPRTPRGRERGRQEHGQEAKEVQSVRLFRPGHGGTRLRRFSTEVFLFSVA